MVLACLFVSCGNKNSYTEYYPNGEIRAIYSKNECCFDGNFVIYYENGNKKRMGTFDNNKLVDLTSYYLNDKYNSLHRTSLRVNDSLVYNVIFYTNGAIMKEGYQMHREKVGDWKIYNQSGEILRIEKFSPLPINK